MIDPISDLLNRIRNGQAVLKDTVRFPFSEMKHDILKIIEKEGYIKELEVKGRIPKKTIEAKLIYKDKIPAVSGLKRISKPGKRIYATVSEMKRMRRGFKTIIVSTPKGLKTGKEAIKQNLGGEILLEIW